MAPPTMPPITHAHRLAAFEGLSLRCTFTAAMADGLRARLIEARAAQLRTAEWLATATPTTQVVRRVTPGGDAWRTQRVHTGWAAPAGLPVNS